MKKILIILSLLFVMGCQLNTEIKEDLYSKTFVNKSNIDISIEPNGQDWNGFILAAQTTRTIKIKEEKCYFVYNYADLLIVYIENKSVIFEGI